MDDWVQRRSGLCMGDQASKTGPMASRPGAGYFVDYLLVCNAPVIKQAIIAPSNGPAKPPLNPQQKHDMICQTLDNITKGAAVASDITLNFSAGSFAVAGVAAINIEGAPISEPIAAGATVVGAVSGLGGLGIKAYQYGNTAFARWAMGCNNPW